MTYVSPSSLLGMAVAFMVIGSFLFVVRLFIRRSQKLPQGFDDWFLLPALLLMLAMCINMVAAVSCQRMGITVSPRVDADGQNDFEWGWSQAASEHEKFVYAQEIIFPLQLTCAKLSILFFYRRVLCPNTHDFFHWATLSTITLTSLWGLAFFLCFAFQCGSSFSLIWDGPLYIAGEKCLGLTIEAGLSISDFILDVVILLLPIRRIFTLQMPLGKKLLVATAFALAGLTVAVSFIRGLVLERVIRGVTSDFTGMDEAMVNSTALYWGLLESGLSVVVACLPSLQYLFVVALPQRIAKTFGSRGVGGAGPVTESRGRRMMDTVSGSKKGSSMWKDGVNSKTRGSAESEGWHELGEDAYGRALRKDWMT